MARRSEPRPRSRRSRSRRNAGSRCAHGVSAPPRSGRLSPRPERRQQGWHLPRPRRGSLRPTNGA
eukprot:14049934-Heterocapsa_arctica.AAC.1